MLEKAMETTMDQREVALLCYYDQGQCLLFVKTFFLIIYIFNVTRVINPFFIIRVYYKSLQIMDPIRFMNFD